MSVIPGINHRVLAIAVALYTALIGGSALAADARLQPENAPPGAQFGAAVALHGGYAVVGAPDDDGISAQSGAAYVFALDGSATWKLAASDGTSNDRFGRAVAIDGDVVVVGAANAVYVFRLTESNTWVEEATIPGSCGQGDFGAAVAVSGDRMLVGSPLIGCLGTSTKGYVFFYRHVGDGDWQLELSFNTRYNPAGDYFGAAVDLDGDTAVVGAPGWGQVFVYTHDGALWQQSTVIADPLWGSGRWFGAAVAIHADSLIVGAPLDGELGQAAGAAYAFHRTPAGWTPEGKLLPPMTDPPQAVTGSRFGSSVDVSGDFVVVGAPESDAGQDVEQAGTAVLFAWDGTSWKFDMELDVTDAAPSDRLGTDVAVDNSVILAGAPGANSDNPSSGAAYIFVRSGSDDDQQMSLAGVTGPR